MRTQEGLYRILLVIGVVILLSNLNVIPAMISRSFGVLWPLLLILAGVYSLTLIKEKDDEKPLAVQVGTENYVIKSAFIKDLMVVVAVGLALTVGATLLFGVIGPIIAVILVLLGSLLLLTIGIPLLALMIPLLVIASPVLALLFIISLIL